MDVLTCLSVFACSEEVIGRAQANVRDLCLTRSRVELQEIILHELVDLHYGGLVSTSIAVVRRRENCHDVALVRPIVAIHDQLMGTGNSRQVIGVIELLGDVLTEAVAGTTGRDTPTAALIRVRPK